MRNRIVQALLPILSIAYGQQQATSFDVDSVRPSNSSDRRPKIEFQQSGRVSMSNVSVRRVIGLAYGLKDYQISGGPGWLGSELFDINAKPDNPAGPDEMLLMIQSLLAKRFQLEVRRDTREMPVYALVSAKGGAKLKEVGDSDPDMPDLASRLPADRQGSTRPRMTVIRRGLLMSQSATMPALSTQLASFVGRAVIDKTGLTGAYDVKLEWVPDETQVALFQTMGVPEGFGAPPPDWHGPSLFTALEEQLGLKLESQRGPVEMLAIVRVEKPSAN